MPIATFKRLAMTRAYRPARDVGDIVAGMVALASDPRFVPESAVQRTLSCISTSMDSLLGPIWAEEVIQDWAGDDSGAYAVVSAAHATAERYDQLDDDAMELVRALRRGHTLLGSLMGFVDSLDRDHPDRGDKVPSGT